MLETLSNPVDTTERHGRPHIELLRRCTFVAPDHHRTSGRGESDVGVSDEVVRALEQRLHEVEAHLGAYAELTDERARLKRALSELQASDGAAPQRATTRPAARAGTRRRRAARRARRGSNIAAILGHVETNPGATAAEIAAGTGIDRGVVYSATSRLTSAGRLRRIPKGDREVGYEVVDSGKATTEP